MKKILIVLLMTGLVTASCKKSLDINQNPNQPTSVTPNVILSAALVNNAADYGELFPNMNCWMGYWSRSGNYTPDVQTETYNITTSYPDILNAWTAIYLNLNSYQNLENVGVSVDNPFYIGVARTMKALNFSTLVDVWGNVPYSQALNITGTNSPKYDDAQTIYTDLIHQLDTAIDEFNYADTSYYPAEPSTVLKTDDAADVMYGSITSPSLVSGPSDFADRMKEWARFANTVKLKLCIHESQVSAQQSFIQQELAKDSTVGYLGAGESALVNPGYTTSTGKINPFYSLFFTLTGDNSDLAYYRANNYAINFYNNSGNNSYGPDFREYLTYALLSNYTIVGNYEGDPASLQNGSTSQIGPGLLQGYSQNQLILSDFESLFLQAEAAQRGWTSGSPIALYESAITQSYAYLYINNSSLITNIIGGSTPAADAQNYYTSGVVDADFTVSTPLEAILTQKWIALNGINAEEAWTDYRRTGYPTSSNLGLSYATGLLENAIPVRFLYPQTEYATNPSNVPTLAANAQFTDKIFWNQ